MSVYCHHSSKETVRYKNWKNEAENEQDAEILISYTNQAERSPAEKGKTYLLLNKCFTVSIVMIVITLVLSLGASYQYKNFLQNSPSKGKNNSDISCVPLQKVTKLFIITERTEYNSCSDNETCHSFLDTIEQQHDGLKYNFVIGARGELYIGSGFKCSVSREESALYVKLLKRKERSILEYLKPCTRLSEIINHGISCEKISQDYETQIKLEHDNDYLTASGEESCTMLEFGKNRSYHFHDPGHEMRRLVHPNIRWTICGNFSSVVNVEKVRVISVESLPKHSCLPLQLVDEITVDVVETPPFSCSDDSSCLHTFEENHDGFKYNFIIGHNHDLYVGLGFKCSAENTSGKVMKIKVLKTPHNEMAFWNLQQDGHKIMQIINEGIYCGKVSETYSVKANCNFAKQDMIGYCSLFYETLSDGHLIHNLLDSDKHYNISSEHGRGVVPSTFKYQFCFREQTHETSTPKSEYSGPTPSSEELSVDYDIIDDITIR